MDLPTLEATRKQALKRIGELLECEVLVYAGNTSDSAGPAPTSIDYDDLLPFSDLVQDLNGKRIAVIIETFGGSGEVGRDMVEMLHERFEHVVFIIPGWAKSTGTIMAMGAHEIYMGPASALGPIDAQLFRGDRVFSADALIEGLEAIKSEVVETGSLNLAYYPILEKISPGDIQHARNALLFARDTVRNWLVKYKFGNWTKRRSSGEPVTDDYRRQRAEEIAEALSSQSRWFTHGRSLRIPDLVDLKLDITDFSEQPELFDAIQRYHVLLRLYFQSTNAAKIMETTKSHVARRMVADAPPRESPQSVVVAVKCANCGTDNSLQLDFAPGVPQDTNAQRWPNSGTVLCNGCGNPLDVGHARQQIEAEVGQPSLYPQPET